jgi:hypothetical protein
LGGGDEKTVGCIDTKDECHSGCTDWV